MNPFKNSIIKSPVYHGSGEIFNHFTITSDIGYHFGTKRAASERLANKNVGKADIEIKADFPTKLEVIINNASQKNIKNIKNKKELLKTLLLMKLEDPSLSSIHKELKIMDDKEISKLIEEYKSKPNSNNYYKSLINYSSKSRKFKVIINGEIYKIFDNPNDAEQLVKKLKIEQSKPKKYYINITKPLYMKDLGLWSCYDIAKELKLNNKTIDYIFSLESEKSRYKFLIKIIKKMGYDGIIYNNLVEDYGSISYIVFNDNQIKEI